MDIEEKQAEHIEFFVKQASSVNGGALANVVVEATSHPFLFAFSEILAVPNVIELEGTENSIFLDLLHVFSYGTWSDYKSDASRLPQLVHDQVIKLKQLTVLTLAETNKVLPYDTLMQELDVCNVRELENFLINDCIYVGILRGKLDNSRRCFEVQFAAARDLRPGQLGNLIQVLANWLNTSNDLLVSIQEKIKWADSMAEIDKKHKKEMDERVEDVKMSLAGFRVLNNKPSMKEQIKYFSLVDLLRMFSHGTWTEYKSDANRLPQLEPDQVVKLKQLPVFILAETNKVLPYDTLMQESDVYNVRELEYFLINDCMYVGIPRGRINQLRRCFEQGGDLRPGGSMIEVLARDLRPGLQVLANRLTKFLPTRNARLLFAPDAEMSECALPMDIMHARLLFAPDAEMAECALPTDIMLFIFALLPAKKVNTLKTLSTLWRQLLSSSYFDRIFKNKFSLNPLNESLVLFDTSVRTMCITKLDQDPIEWHSIDLPLIFPEYMGIVGSCKGLFCIEDMEGDHATDIFIFNPALDMYEVVPPSKAYAAYYQAVNDFQMEIMNEADPFDYIIIPGFTSSLGFGYDNITKDFWIFRITCPLASQSATATEVDICEIFLLNSHTWFTFAVEMEFGVQNHSVVSVNGTPYWLAYTSGGDEPEQMVRYNFLLRNFEFIPLPPAFSLNGKFLDCGGNLGYVEQEEEKENIGIISLWIFETAWRLEDVFGPIIWPAKGVAVFLRNGNMIGRVGNDKWVLLDRARGLVEEIPGEGDCVYSYTANFSRGLSNSMDN